MSHKRHFAEVDGDFDDKKRFKVQNETSFSKTPPPTPPFPPTQLGPVPPPPKLGPVPPPPKLGAVPPPPLGHVPPPPKLGGVPPPPSRLLAPTNSGSVQKPNQPPLSVGLPASKEPPSSSSGTKFSLAPKKLLKAPNIAFQVRSTKKHQAYLTQCVTIPHFLILDKHN